VAIPPLHKYEKNFGKFLEKISIRNFKKISLQILQPPPAELPILC
jgi:hypothetical protein